MELNISINITSIEFSIIKFSSYPFPYKIIRMTDASGLRRSRPSETGDSISKTGCEFTEPVPSHPTRGGAALFFSWSFLRLFFPFSYTFLILFLYFSYTFLLLSKKRKAKKRPRKGKKSRGAVGFFFSRNP